MKILILSPFICCLGLHAATPAPAANAPVELTLGEAFDRIELANQNVLIGRENIGAATEGARLARAGLLPSITLNAQQYRTRTVGSSTGTTSLYNRFDGSLDGSAALLNVQQIATWQSSRAGVQVAELDYLSTVQDTLASLGQAFFTHLRNLKRRTVIEDNINRARVLLTLAENQFKAGVATQIDVTRAQALLSTAEQSRMQQETVVYQSELNLKRLLNLPADEPLLLERFSVRRTEPVSGGQSLEAEALALRADYQSALHAVEQAKLTVRAARAERLPVLNAVGQYGYSAPDVMDHHQKEAWLAGLSLSLPVFDSSRSDANRRIALAQLRTSQLRLDALEKQVAVEVRSAVQDSKSRLAQISAAEDNFALAQEELRLARLRYEQGVADNREVVDAQNRLALASDNLVEAVHQYNLARLELARSRGNVRIILTKKSP
ncbi:MAG: TolC family protein [Opitutaceae bacterium]|nr:TolC family protein [Opitutaceae bacterium]